MRSAAAHGKTSKSKSESKSGGRRGRPGRHAAPPPWAKAARHARWAAPVLVAAGVLAVVPHLRHDGPAPPRAGAIGASGSLDAAGRRHAGQATPFAVVTHGLSQIARQSLRRRRPARAGGAPAHGASASPAPAAPPPGASASPAATAAHCAGSGGMLPENYPTIVGFLMAHGYAGLAAAGIAGNIYQESGGNPESVGTGGGGLIGWTPLPSGFVTGNAAADLQTQLQALLAYNQQWSQYIPALNAAASATQAADIYMNDFERPGFPAAANREGAANAVASACGL